MPIEIRELSIKVNVNQGENQQVAAPVTGANNDEEKSALIKEAVEQVLQIIANKKER